MHKLLEPYAALVPFLGVALGDNVEIALHDLTSPEQEVVAIANGEISGREVGAKLSNLSVHYLETKQYEKSDYVMNYKTAGPDGKHTGSRNQEMFILLVCFVLTLTSQILNILKLR